MTRSPEHGTDSFPITPATESAFNQTVAIFNQNHNEIFQSGVTHASVWFDRYNQAAGCFIKVRLSRPMTEAEAAAYPTDIAGIPIVIEAIQGKITPLTEALKMQLLTE